MTEQERKPVKYYVDFENVHGAGLKGVDELTERDEVIIIYSQAAETFHIEHAIDILKSKANIQFLEADAGTRNAADFQLIVALYANMDDAYDYAIVSGDTGFDAAIKMGERMGKPAVRRLGNIIGDEAEPEKPKSRRSRRSRSGRDSSKESATESPSAELSAEGGASISAEEDATSDAGASASAEEAVQSGEAATSEQAGDKKPSSSRRRPRRRKRSSSPDEQSDAQDEASQAQDGTTRDERAAPAAGSDALATPEAPEAEDADALVKKFLAEKDIELPDAKTSTIASALGDSDGRQSFYRRIIKIEGQQNGRALYRQVREHYEALLQTIEEAREETPAS